MSSIRLPRWSAERGYSGGSTSETQVTASYTGVTNVQEDLNKYREYLSTQGFVDYFGMEDVRAAMVLRRGDDALVFSANNESDTLNLTLNWSMDWSCALAIRSTCRAQVWRYCQL